MATTPKKKMARNAVVKKSLAETHPQLAKEADGWDANTVSTSSAKKLPWKCSRGHKWEAVVANRAKGNGCPVCAGQMVLSGFNDLRTLFPKIASEALGWDTSTVRPGSNIKRKWVCKNGHSWLTSPNQRTGRDKTGCPYCSNVKVLKGFNDVGTLFPAIVKEAEGWKPSEYLSGSHRKMKWRCSNGHLYIAEIKHRCYSGTGCPFCSGNKVLIGFNDLHTVAPLIAGEADGWDTTKYTKGSHQKKTWKCQNGHKWKAEIASRVNGAGCPYCSGHSVEAGFNDLGTLYPEIAQQAYGWDTKIFTANSGEKKLWMCSQGHTWKARIADRTSGKGCPVCSGNQVLIGFNDLQTTHPDLSSQCVGWDATKYSAGSGAKKKWRCSEGHVWTATISNRVNGRGCPSCADFGFDQTKLAYIYLLRHEVWQMYKIGISNSRNERTERHESRGWEVLEMHGPMKGSEAYRLEQGILKMLKSQGADLGRDDIAGKFDGYTESWVADSFPVTSIKELMDLVHKDESFLELDTY